MRFPEKRLQPRLTVSAQMPVIVFNRSLPVNQQMITNGQDHGALCTNSAECIGRKPTVHIGCFFHTCRYVSRSHGKNLWFAGTYRLPIVTKFWTIPCFSDFHDAISLFQGFRSCLVLCRSYTRQLLPLYRHTIPEQHRLRSIPVRFRQIPTGLFPFSSRSSGLQRMIMDFSVPGSRKKKLRTPPLARAAASGIMQAGFSETKVLQNNSGYRARSFQRKR